MVTKLVNAAAFISEVNARGASEGAAHEYVEITILADQVPNLSDYVLGFYVASTGLLVPGPNDATGGNRIAGSSFFQEQGEFTLQDVFTAVGGVGGELASSVGGLPLKISEHPDAPSEWLIFQIPSSMIRGDNQVLSQGAGTVALTHQPSGSAIAYNVGGGSTAALVDGAAAGTIQEETAGRDSRIDIFGRQFSSRDPSNRTQGSSVLCLTNEALVKTPSGPKRCEDLVVGDEVETLDNGAQKIRWIGRRRVTEVDLAANPKLYPVRITAGSLGQGLPSRDLVVSRQHRMLITSKIAERVIGSRTALIPSVKLTPLQGVDFDESVTEVTYVHLLFDNHEVIFAEDAPTESLYVARGFFESSEPEAIEEVMTLFPELREQAQLVPAKPLLDGRDAKEVVRRHLKNDKVVLDALGQEAAGSV